MTTTIPANPLWDPTTEPLLKRRADQLARVPVTHDSGDEVEVLMCQLRAEGYAVETRWLRALQWVSQITPVPCTPAYVLGIVSVRGEIVPVLDLGSMLGLGPRQAELEHDSGSRPVLLLDLPGIRAGLVVDEVFGVERLALGELEPSLSGRDFARGLLGGATVLLDLEQLFASGRFDVLEEV
jgi:purine-binding chemotaxis protein CheW